MNEWGQLYILSRIIIKFIIQLEKDIHVIIKWLGEMNCNKCTQILFFSFFFIHLTIKSPYLLLQI